MSYPNQWQQQQQQQPQQPRHDVQRAPRGRPLTFWQTVWAVTLGVLFAGIIFTVLTWVAAFVLITQLGGSLSDTFSDTAGSPSADCYTRWMDSDAPDYTEWASTNC